MTKLPDATLSQGKYCLSYCYWNMENLMSDNQKPVTYRNTSCFEQLKSSFSGDILDNAKLYQSKEEVPDNQKAYSIVASEDISEPIGYLLNEFEQTIASRCSSGQITASTL